MKKVFFITNMGFMAVDTGEWESLKRQKVIDDEAIKSFNNALHDISYFCLYHTLNERLTEFDQDNVTFIDI